ncbi:MAG: hypothetical protein M3Y56_05435, partial [Armatimonadota bacterium]|nr:hypothetical protein [Armatimonadota bacterium]
NNHNTGMTADLTTEATLQPGEWGPIEFPLGLNLLQNGSFESPLAATPAEGWAVGDERSGKATITADTAYSGTHSLRLEQTDPVIFSPESYNEPDYGRFINGANGGKGGARMEVIQQVPVIGGHHYSFRLHFKLSGAMGGEAKKTGHPRGYDSFQIWLSWIGAPGGEWISNVQSGQLEWKTLLNSRAMYTLLNPPFVAPAGATGVRVSISLVGNAEGFKPKATVDQVELVEVH